MRCLHKTSCNALVGPWTPIEDRHLIPDPHAGSTMAARARLPRSHGRRPDLRVPGVCRNPSAADDRSLSAEHLAGSIHDFLANVRVVYSAVGPGDRSSTAHLDFYRLAFG